MKKICGYFYVPDPFYDDDDDDEEMSCNNVATHFSCNYGNVCIEHKCLCVNKGGNDMKITVKREVNKYQEVGTPGVAHISSENLPIETVESDPHEGAIEILGQDGIRVKWGLK